MSYHHRLTKIEARKSQLAKEELALEREHKDVARKYDTRRKIFCGAIFLKKIYEAHDPDAIRIFTEELKKAPLKTQQEFPEFFEKENHIFGEKVKLTLPNKTTD